MINNHLLALAARGAQPRIADAMFRGQQQGNALRKFQQQEQDRNALATIAQAYERGGPEAARQVAGQTGQLDALQSIDNTQYRRGRDKVSDQRFERQFDYRQGRDQAGDQFRNKQFDATQNFRNQQIGLQRDSLSQRRELAQQKRADKTAAKKRGKPTVDSAKSAGFFDRMSASDKIISSPESTEAATNLGLSLAGKVPVAGNFMVTPEFRKFDQAKRDFVNSILRRESGAVISDQEFANAEVQYFPRPGDDPDVIRQKAENRKIAIEGIRRAGLPSLGEGATQTSNADLKSKYGLE